MDQKMIDEGKGLAWLSYLWIFFLVPLLAMKDNEYCKYHAKQGLILFISWIGGEIIGEIISTMLKIIPTIGYLIGHVIELIITLVLFILMVIGIINALSGKTEPLPVIGKYAEKIKL